MDNRLGTFDASAVADPIGDILAAIGQPILVHRAHLPLYCNEAFARLFGYRDVAAALAVPDMLALMPEAEHAAIHRRHQAVLDGDPAASAPETCLRRRPDGSSFWVEIRRARINWGGAPAVLSAVVDVSERVAAEAMGGLLRDTLDGFSEAILITDPQDRVIMANRSYHALHPDLPRRDAIIGLDYGAVLRAMAERLAASMLPGTIDVGIWVEEQLLAHRGVTGIAKDTFSVGARHYQRQRERVANGGIVTVITDVTARRQFETALAERESVLRQAARIARWGHYIWDEDLKRMVDCSPELADLLGVPLAELFERARGRDRFLFLVHPDDRDGYASALQTFDGELFDRRARFCRPDGEVMHVHEVAQLYWSGASFGRHGLLIGVVQDVTEHARAEERLRAAKDQAERALAELRETQGRLVQAEKLAALGGLVAGVAHEINTPVGIALTGASHLDEEASAVKRAYEAQELTAEALDAFLRTATEASRLILSNATRAATLIQSFKLVSSDSAGEERRSFVLRGYVEEIVTSLGPRLRGCGHALDLRIDPAIVLDSFPGALWQVITNLVMNALMHAFPPGRTGRMAIAAEAIDADHVQVTFTDDGRGIPPDIQGRIFDPFFTTNRAAGGTGLGLNIAFNLVTGPLGGWIGVASPPTPGGRGTQFTLTIPRVAPSAGAALGAALRAGSLAPLIGEPRRGRRL